MVDYRVPNRRILEGYPRRRTFYSKMAPYLGVTPKQVLRETPPPAFKTLLSLWKPPYLELEPRTLCRGGPFNKLRKVDRVPSGYLGIGGSNIPLRCLLLTIAMRKYQEDIENLTGDTPRIFLFDAAPYDSLNSIDPQFSGDIVDQVLDGVDTDFMGYRKGVFERMAEVSGLKLEVVTASELMSTRSYRDNLGQLLDQRGEMESSWEQLVPPRFRDNPMSLLYPPMEVAEALALADLYDVGLKFGPEAEKGFDALIFRSSPGDSSPMIFCYTPDALTENGPRTPYRNPYDITLDMDLGDARSYLEAQPEFVLDQFQGILDDLNYPCSNVIGETLDVLRRIRGE